MKTLINKGNPQIRITAPEIVLAMDKEEYWIAGIPQRLRTYLTKDWTLVEEEPKKVNCPFDKGNCNYCTVQFCGARENVTTITTSTSLPVVEEEHPDNFTSFEWLVGRLMFRGCDLWGMTDGEDDNGIVTKLIKDRAVEMTELLERELDPNAEPVDFDEIAEKWVIETASGTADEEEFLIDIFKKGLEMGYNLGKGGSK